MQRTLDFLDFINSECRRRRDFNFPFLKVACSMDREIATIFSSNILAKQVGVGLNITKKISRIYVINRNKCKSFLRKGLISYDEVCFEGRLIAFYLRKRSVFIWLYDAVPPDGILDRALNTAIFGVFIDKGYVIVDAAAIDFQGRKIVTPDIRNFNLYCISLPKSKALLYRDLSFLAVKSMNSKIFAFQFVNFHKKIRYIRKIALKDMYFFSFSPLCKENRLHKVRSMLKKRHFLPQLAPFHKTRLYLKVLDKRIKGLLPHITFYKCLMGTNKRENKLFLFNYKERS